MAQVKRTVAVLFTDLVGSTLISQRLDVQSADELRERHFALLSAEVGAVGGSVVKNLGDGLMVVFDVPTAALACAVAMQQAVDRDSRGTVDRLAMRVGIAFGEATEKDNDFFGDPVVEAARLCAAAQGGRILATDVVRVVVGRRVVQELVSVGDLELKGLPDPVPSVEVLWEPIEDDGGSVPLPRRLDRQTDTGTFVGRKEEIALLAQALKEAGADKHRRVVLVSGEPGIGKTTLAGVFARSVHKDGAIVLYGRCDEDLGIPYQPWAEAIGHLVTNAPPELLDDVLASKGADLAHLGQALEHLDEHGRGSSADRESARYLLFGAILSILETASTESPLVVVLDDLQWADIPTLQVLRHLIASDRDLRMLIVATFRESGVAAGDPLADLLAGLHREVGVTRIGLRGLSDADLLALMEAAAGHSIGANGVALRDALSRETDGNPFFVFELLRHLIETEAIFQGADGRWMASGDITERGLPVSVREVIGQRVSRLGDEAVRVLSMASVIGREFELSLLAAASDMVEVDLLDVLDAAVAATLVVNVAGERYSFVHALVGHALYEALRPARRARAHRSVASAIEETCGSDPGSRVGELAYHWAQATAPQDVTKAITYARAAGDRALVQLAPDEALRWYGQALGLLEHQSTEDLRLRAVLLVGLGDAQRQIGDPQFGRTLLDAGRLAQHEGDNSTLIAATLANNRGLFSAIGQVDAERIGMIREALAVVGDVDSKSRARLLVLLAAELTWNGDYPARRAIADEALAVARRLGDPETVRDVLLLRHNTTWVPETVAERMRLSIEADELADAVGDPVGQFWSAIQRYGPALETGNLAEMIPCRERYRSLATQIGQPTIRWLSAWMDTVHCLVAGQTDEAEVLANEAFQIAQDCGQPDAWIIYGGAISTIRTQEGRDSELVDALEASVAANPGNAYFTAALARISANNGRDDEARRLLNIESATSFGFPKDPILLSMLVQWAEVAARLGELAAAEMLYDRLSPWHDQVVFNGAVVFGPVAYYLGEMATSLSRYDLAENHFEQALSLATRLQAPFDQARTHLGWGRVLCARALSGDEATARSHLETARDLASRHGYRLVEHRATDLLNEHWSR